MTTHMVFRRKMKAAIVAGALASFGAALCAQPVGARANSLQDFFSEQFGLGTSQAPSAPALTDDNPFDHPLVVRQHHRKLRSVARAASPIGKGPIGPVSIYEDKTLRRGDAVMTAHGIRIFKGSATMPYQESDFAVLSDQDGLSKDVSKTLVAMDRVSRN